MRLNRQLEFVFPGKKETGPVVGPVQLGVGKMDVSEQALADRCVTLLKVLGCGALAAKIKVAWNPRMRTTAGRAFWPEAKIELNPKLKDMAQGEVDGTLLHELAHLLAYHRAGRRRIAAHGTEWRQACVDLGIPGEKATHTLPLPGRTMQRKWRYTCPACGEGFDRVRKMKRYAGCYRCCKAHNGGYYHQKFRLAESRIQP